MNTTITTPPNHTSDANDTKVNVRPYKSYAHYVRELERNAKPYLEDQRIILGAIIFDRDGHKLMKSLTPAAFSRRNYEDFNDERGHLQLLAEVAFTYWEQHGAPPGAAIYDLVATLPERVSHIAHRMEGHQRAIEAADARERAVYEKSLGRHDDSEVEQPSTRLELWSCERESIENFIEEVNMLSLPLNNAARPARATRTQRHKTRRQQAEMMLRARKSRREIIDFTGYTAARISQIAGELDEKTEAV